MDSLTLEQASIYQKQVDKLLWIEYNILDQLGLPVWEVIKVEDALIDILKAHGLYEGEVGLD
jgi:hypothetical protein